MSTKHSLSSFGMVAVFAAVVFVVAFALLLMIGGYGVIASFFMAALIAFLAAIVLFLGLGNPASQTEPLNRSGTAGTASATGSTVAAGAAGAAAVAGAGAAAASAPDNGAAERAAAAKRAEAEQAARQAADEARAKAAADEDAARKAAAAAEAEAKRKAEMDAARAKAEAEAKAAEKAEAARRAAEASAPAADAGGIPDYDGDGKLEGVNEGSRPVGLDGPRGGKADDLKQIKGIGPKLEKLCNSLGFWHFDQVAAWTGDEVAWVDANLQGFKGRVTRDTWVEQAKVLARGGETEFSKRVEGGDVY